MLTVKIANIRSLVADATIEPVPSPTMPELLDAIELTNVLSAPLYSTIVASPELLVVVFLISNFTTSFEVVAILVNT